MKFYLIAVMLLASLKCSNTKSIEANVLKRTISSVFANRANLPPSTTKVLYSSAGSEGSYVLAENFTARVLTYYRKDGHLIFETKNNNSMVHLDEFMKIKDDQLKSFAVVSFAYEPSDRREQEFCRQQTSGKLRHLIISCHNKIALRELTEEETN